MCPSGKGGRAWSPPGGHPKLCHSGTPKPHSGGTLSPHLTAFYSTFLQTLGVLQSIYSCAGGIRAEKCGVHRAPVIMCQPVWTPTIYSNVPQSWKTQNSNGGQSERSYTGLIHSLFTLCLHQGWDHNLHIIYTFIYRSLLVS